MKKTKKSMIILFSILAVIGIAVGGCSMHQYQKKQEMIAIATSDEARKIYEEYMKKKDPKAFTKEGIIRDYVIDNKSLYYNPMGGIEVKTYINNDTKLDIQFGIVKNSEGKLEPSGYTYSGELSKLLGE